MTKLAGGWYEVLPAASGASVLLEAGIPGRGVWVDVPAPPAEVEAILAKIGRDADKYRGRRMKAYRRREVAIDELKTELKGRER